MSQKRQAVTHKFQGLPRKAQFEVALVVRKHDKDILFNRMMDQLDRNKGDEGVGWRNSIELTEDEVEETLAIVEHELDQINGPQRPYHQLTKFKKEAEHVLP